MVFKKCLLLAIAIVGPLTLLLWLTFSAVLLVALYPGVKVQMVITAMQSNAPITLFGLLCGALVNTLLYSVVIFLLKRYEGECANGVEFARHASGARPKLTSSGG